MLLCRQKGCNSFPGIRTVNEVVCPTCQAACEALGLLENDREWEIMLEESALTATPAELRTLLAHILTFYQVSDPIKLWNLTWKSIYGLRMPPEHLMSVLRNRLLMEEKSYDRTLLAAHRDQLLPQLHDKQLSSVSRSMATTSISKSTSEEMGKMIMTKPNVTIIADLKPMDTNKTIEAVVYRKWTSKHVQTHQPMKYCCILLDKQGTPIQANMDVKDTAYLDRLLQLYKAYRISGFRCEQTGLWERTLDNPTSLIFGRFIQLEEVPGEDFPGHYFNFASYNKHAARADVRNAMLTIPNQIHTSGDATSNRIHRRIIDIQNLSGNTISLALWHDMAVNFNLQEYEALERLVVIAVSSCWVRRYHGLQLSSTSTTHYYLNPNIPETFHIKQVHQQLPEPQVMLNIENQRYENPEEEMTRNRFPLATIFDLDPQNYEGVRFTSEATIYKINTQKKWYYQRCTSCKLQVIPGDPFPTCKNHGPQPTPVYSGSSSRRRDLVLDRVLESTVLPLPAPPPQVIPLEPIIEEQPRASQVLEPTAATISEHQPEAIQHTKPLSPTLSTPTSNQPEVVEPETAETKEP
nr:hypothetical protein [Tanacetum cinerariifolium]